ncbi:MAG: porin family protein [Bdellovibrionaceae bacterium]|nr:porin family protein [Pseudobdellovibrionaceae bacterium]
MKNKILLLVLGLMISPAALAQEFGALVGVHQTSADAESSAGSVDGKFNFKAGVSVGFELNDAAKFRTGLLYNQRHLDYSVSGGKYELNFAYFDVPALVQYNVNEMFGFFGGLVVGINVNDDIKAPVGATPSNADVEKLIPLLSVGFNMTFQDQIGFDVYYERGMGGIADNLIENYSTFGASFLYWF